MVYSPLGPLRRASGDATENPTFLSVSCGNANFLRPDPSVASALESGGANVGGITDDIDGNIRQGNAGYAGAGPRQISVRPNSVVSIRTSSAGDQLCTLGSGASVSTRAFTNVVVTDASGVNGTRNASTCLLQEEQRRQNTFNDNTSATVGWKYAEANGATSPFDFTIDYSRVFGGTVSTATPFNTSSSRRIISGPRTWGSIPVSLPHSQAALP